MAEQQERRSVGERREQLIDASIAVLARDGIGAATTRRITDEAGLALGAFHYAFTSKDDLLRAVIERFTVRVEQSLREVVLEPDSSLDDLAYQIVRGFWRFVEENADLQLAQYEVTIHALRDPAMRPLAESQYERMTEAVEQVLEEHPAVADGPGRRDVASYLVAVMDGLILYRVVERDEGAAERRLNLLMSTMPALITELQRLTERRIAIES